MINNISVCSCGDGSSINNYGEPGCLNGLDVPRDVVFLSQRKTDATLNGIDTSTATLDEAFFDGVFLDVDVSDRWLMNKGVEDFQSPPADANTFEFPSGSIVKLSEGIRTVVMTFPTPDPYKLKAKLDSMACRSMSVMYVDRNGSLVGQSNGDFFIGRQIADGSLDAKAFDKTDTEASRVELSFQYERRAKDVLVDFIVEDSLGGYTLDQVTPLNDVNINITAGIAASLTFDLFLDYGGVFGRIPAEGLTITELDITKDGVVEPLATLVETSAGTYLATYTTPVSVSTVMEVRGILAVYVQKQYDLKRLIGKTFTTTA